jgi:hypothetical protein
MQVVCKIASVLHSLSHRRFDNRFPFQEPVCANQLIFNLIDYRSKLTAARVDRKHLSAFYLGLVRFARYLIPLIHAGKHKFTYSSALNANRLQTHPPIQTHYSSLGNYNYCVRRMLIFFAAAFLH